MADFTFLIFSTTVMTEAVAIRAAMLVRIELGCQDVEVESDSQMLIRMLNGEYAVDATLECFINDIGLLVSQLGRVRFLFVKRDGNAVVHAVVSYVVSHEDAFRWDALVWSFYLIF